MKQRILRFQFAVIVANMVIGGTPALSAPVEQIECLKPGLSSTEWNALADDAAAQKDGPDPALQDKLAMQVIKCTAQHGWSEADGENAVRYSMMGSLSDIHAAKLSPETLKIADAHLALHRAEYAKIDNFMDSKGEGLVETLIAEGLPASDEEVLTNAFVYLSFNVMQTQFKSDFVAGKLRE
jgi:hypothetical protein